MPIHTMQGVRHARVRALLALTGSGLATPPRFEGIVGYTGGRRYVAFHVDARLTPLVEDGESVQSGHYGALTAWSRHLSVWAALTGAGVNWSGSGPSGGPEHRIVFDRSTRRLYAGLEADVHAFLAGALEAQSFQVEPLQHGPSRSGACGHGQTACAELDQGALASLLAWLDAQPLPCPSCRTIHVAGDFEVGESRRPPEEDRQQGDVNPTCPSCGEPFYGRPLLTLVATLVPCDGVPSHLGHVSDDGPNFRAALTP